jgi:hypothetical protein
MVAVGGIREASAELPEGVERGVEEEGLGRKVPSTGSA